MGKKQLKPDCAFDLAILTCKFNLVYFAILCAFVSSIKLKCQKMLSFPKLRVIVSLNKYKLDVVNVDVNIN